VSFSNIVSLFGFWLLFSLPAQAHLTSDFDMALGYSSISIEVQDRVGVIYSPQLDSESTLEFNYNLNVSGPEISITMSFMEILESEIGSMPLTRLGLGVRWYPRGLNGSKILLDNQVMGRLWGPSPFVGIIFGLSNLSVNDTTTLGSSQLGFNAAVIDGQMNFGVEIPMTSDWMLTGRFSLLTSLLSNPNIDGMNLSYSGIQIFVGMKGTAF
jgi:hypothetical protein